MNDKVFELCTIWRGQELGLGADGHRRLVRLGSPGGGHGNSLQYSCLENPMDEEPGGLHSMGSHRVKHE